MSFTDRLRQAASDINKGSDYDIAVAGEDPNLSDIADRRIESTSKMLNMLLGGGVPLGRMMELYGDESTGKSTLASHIMIGFQQAGGISILLDAETSWKRDRAIRMGHDPDRHLHLQADTVELGFESLFKTIKRLRMPGIFEKEIPIVFVWDTISASQTEGEKEDDRFKDGMADKPRKVREGCRKVVSLLPRCNASLIFVSQTSVVIKKGAGGPPRKQSNSGGAAIRFFSSKRLKMWYENKYHFPTHNSGILIGCTNRKDKVDPPHKKVTLPILHSTGIDYGYEMLLFLIDNSPYVNMSGGKVHVPDYPEPGEEITFSQKQLPKIVEQYPDLLDHFAACVDDVWPSYDG